MPKFEFSGEICLGFSHFGGGVYESYEGEVELTDGEVTQLVELMRKKESTKVADLDLEEIYPDIYRKLEDAYTEAACNAERLHWLDQSYDDVDGWKCDLDDVKCYLMDRNALGRGMDELEFSQLSDDEQEDTVMDSLRDYVNGLQAWERLYFYEEILGLSIGLVECYSRAGIPDAIKEMAFPGSTTD